MPSSMGERYVNIYMNEISLIQAIYLAYNKYRALSLGNGVHTYLELLEVTVRHLTEKINKVKPWNKRFLHE